MANGLRPLYCSWPRCFVYHTIPFGAAFALSQSYGVPAFPLPCLGGARMGEEVRDGPHNNNRGGGNRGGVAPTAAPIRSRAGSLSGFRPFVLDRNIRHFLWYGGVAGEGLRSDGVDDLPLSKSVCSILPIARHFRAGVLRGSGLYTAVGRAVLLSPFARPMLCALSALRGTSGDATMSTPGGRAHASQRIRTISPCSPHRVLS